MKSVRLRHLAEINPSRSAFDNVPDAEPVTFMPLETVWADNRCDVSRSRPRGDVSTGYVRFQAGDILTPKVTPTFQAARSALIESLPHRAGAASTEVHVVRTKDDRADARFVRYALLSKPFLDEGVTRFQGVAGLQRVPDEFIRDFAVIDVPLDEQRRIADFLDDQVARIDNIIAARREQGVLAGELIEFSRSGIVGGHGRNTVSHQLLGEVNGEWPVRRLNDVVQGIGVGVVVNPSSYFSDDGVPFLHGGNVREEYIDLTGVRRILQRTSDRLWRSRLSAGDVVVVRAGYPGRAAVVTADLDGANCASILLIKPTPSVALADWIALFFNSPQGKSQVSLAQYGAAQEQINVGDVVDFLLPVPDVAVQRDLLGLYRREREELQDAISRLERQRELLDEIKRSLITAAVSGEFDVISADGSRVVPA